MAVSAIDNRYCGPMNRVFDEENRLQKWLDVEAALAYAHGKLGNIPKKDADEIQKKADTRFVKLARVKEIEGEIDHDLMAMVRALSEACKGGAGGYVHYGATSYDIEDTALALVMRDANALIRKRLSVLRKILLGLAKGHKRTVCIGRTHGQHAVPMTYGLKFALWAAEVARNEERLGEAEARVYVGKMSGAVGTMATFGEKAFEVQRLVMERLKIAPALVSNQVIQRDRHAEMLAVLALIACSLEKIANEIRNLQRTELMEVAEPFGKKQVGSSTMPHKRNPHKSERISSLARVVRADLAVALENIALQHERDLTNSANERLIIPEAYILLDYMLSQASLVLSGLEFFPENIKRNLEMNSGLVMAERLMVSLTEKGMGRQEAHEFLRGASRRAVANKRHLKAELLSDPKISQYFTLKEIDGLFDESSYIGKAVEIVERAERELA